MNAPMLLALCPIALLALGSIRRIPEGQVYTLRRVGGHTRILGAGMHLVLPLLERVAHKISLSGSVVDVPGLVSDGAPLRVMVYVQVLDPQRADAVIDGVPQMLRARTAELVRHPAYPTGTAERRTWLKQTLNAEVRNDGLVVTRIDLFPPD